MGNANYVKSFRDLIVYRKARELSKMIFQITRRFPKDEIFSLTSQIRRSSRSIGAQIAEAWAKRRYEAHFISKLTDADGEQQETQHWLETALDCEYLSQEDVDALFAKYEEIGRLLGGMIAKSGQFCNSAPYHVREEQAEYFTSQTTTDY